MKIYVACGLTHVPRPDFESYVQFIHCLASHVSLQLSAEVKYALRDSDPQLSTKPFSERARLCYLWDRQMVEWADVVIAEASYPSIGLGIELQIAEAEDKPIVLAFRRDEALKASPVSYRNPDDIEHDLQLGEGYISLMALGLPSVFEVVGYTSDQDALTQLVAALVCLDRPAT